MKNYFKYDFINKAIVGSKTAIKRASSGNGNEYRELCKMLAEHPNFNVVPKDIEKNHNKKKYNGLTFDRMKEYIVLQDDNENDLAVFKKVQDIAEAKGAKYPLTKKWFLSKYPEYKENEATVIEDKKITEQAMKEVESLEFEDDEPTEEKMSA